MLTGIETSQNIYTLDDALVRQIKPEVMLKEAEIAPISILLQAMQGYPATQFKTEWPEDEMTPWTDLLNGDHSDSDVTIAESE